VTPGKEVRDEHAQTQNSDELQYDGTAGCASGSQRKAQIIVTKILSDLDQVAEGVALKVPLAELSESKRKCAQR
jgi:hypothetical protein